MATSKEQSEVNSEAVSQLNEAIHKQTVASTKTGPVKVKILENCLASLSSVIKLATEGKTIYGVKHDASHAVKAEKDKIVTLVAALNTMYNSASSDFSSLGNYLKGINDGLKTLAIAGPIGVKTAGYTPPPPPKSSDYGVPPKTDSGYSSKGAHSTKGASYGAPPKKEPTPEEKINSVANEFSGIARKMEDGNVFMSFQNTDFAHAMSAALARVNIVGGSGGPKFVSAHYGDKEGKGLILTQDNLKKMASDNSFSAVKDLCSIYMTTGGNAQVVLPTDKVSDGNFYIKFADKSEADAYSNHLKDLGIKGGGGNAKYVAEHLGAGNGFCVILTKENVEQLTKQFAAESAPKPSRPKGSM